LQKPETAVKSVAAHQRAKRTLAAYDTSSKSGEVDTQAVECLIEDRDALLRLDSGTIKLGTRVCDMANEFESPICLKDRLSPSCSMIQSQLS
jgi:hypothetical protein